MSILLTTLLALPLSPGHGTPDDRLRPPWHDKMVAVLAEIARQAEFDDIFVGSGELPFLRATLELLPADQNPHERWKFLNKIGIEELRLGQTEAAVKSFEEANALHPALAGKVDPAGLRRARFQLALAYLRLGENQNCVARHTSESCILPIGKKGVHEDQQGSRKAIAILSEALAEAPGDTSSVWLLNLAYMTVGEYPDGVPAAYLVSPAAFASDAEFPRFVDVAPELGLNRPGLAGGVILDDFDGDDVLDIFSSEMHPAGQIRFFKGNRDATFTERTVEAGLEGITGGLNIVQTDYDNNGFVDVLVLRGAWLFENGRWPRSLLHNNGDGTFTDVAYRAGLADANYPTQAAGWADYDGDGDLDLYVGNEYSDKIAAPSQLFRNEGNGTFRDVAGAAGVQNNRYAKGVTWGDYDDDGDPDLYVSNIGIQDRLYKNRGDGTFEDVADKLGVMGPKNSFPAWFWDFDNDGALDLYVSTFLPRLEPYVLGLLGQPTNGEYACLFRGDGKGGFRDVAREMGLDDYTLTMGANFGDLDNDGFLDFYLGTGYPGYEALMPNKMYWNRGGKRFADVTTSGGFGHLQKGHAIAFADLDRDGDQDVFADFGGAFTGDTFGNALFRNPGGSGNHSITVKLAGVRSNRAGIGARIRCDVTENGKSRSIYRHVNSGGSFGANPLRQQIGLGQATRIDVLEIRWPHGKGTQVFRDVPADGLIAITEGDETLRRIE